MQSFFFYRWPVLFYFWVPRVKFFSHSRHIHIHDTFKIHSQYIHDTFTIHSWYIHNTFKAHSNYIHEHSKHIQITLMNIQNTFKLHSWTFKPHSNYIHENSWKFKTHSNYIHEHSNIFKLHINTFNHNTFKLHLKTFTVPQNSLDLYYCHTRAQLTIPDHLIHHLRWSAGATSGTIFYLIRPASRRNSFRLVRIWNLD